MWSLCEKNGERTLARACLKWEMNLGHHNENIYAGKPKDLEFYVWYVKHIRFL